jgi:hypothetical protein
MCLSCAAPANFVQVALPFLEACPPATLLWGRLEGKMRKFLSVLIVALAFVPYAAMAEGGVWVGTVSARTPTPLLAAFKFDKTTCKQLTLPRVTIVKWPLHGSIGQGQIAWGTQPCSNTPVTVFLYYPNPSLTNDVQENWDYTYIENDGSTSEIQVEFWVCIHGGNPNQSACNASGTPITQPPVVNPPVRLRPLPKTAPLKP